MSMKSYECCTFYPDALRVLIASFSYKDLSEEELAHLGKNDILPIGLILWDCNNSSSLVEDSAIRKMITDVEKYGDDIKCNDSVRILEIPNISASHDLDLLVSKKRILV